MYEQYTCVIIVVEYTGIDIHDMLIAIQDSDLLTHR